MLSFGIEASLAFSMAFWSARFPAGSGPPSRAATMIARASLEKSCPRLASVAPFFRLICAHLLCPATHRLLLPDHVEEELVHPRVVGQLRMERRDEKPSFAEQDGLAVELGEHLDARARIGDARSADEHPTPGSSCPATSRSASKLATW